MTYPNDPEECYRFGCWERATHVVTFEREGYRQWYCTEHVAEYGDYEGAQIAPYRESRDEHATMHNP